jgi:hypothetical protein
MDHNYVKKIKRWVDLDNIIEEKKAKLKLYTDERKTLEDDILGYVDDNDIKNAQINISDGHIKFSEQQVKQTLSLKLIKDLLVKFFEAKPTNVNADVIYEYIDKKRDTKTKMIMKRHITS